VSDIGKRLVLMIVGALLFAIGLYMILFQQSHYNYEELRLRLLARFVVLIVGGVFIFAGFFLPTVQKGYICYRRPTPHPLMCE